MKPQTIDEIQEVVRSSARVRVRGGGSKSALSAGLDQAGCLEISGITGILEYDPSEFTFVARAGTTLRQIEQALAVHGQYLPFDPPFTDCGATLGGTVAAGLSGPGRYRYGGVRDFLLGVRFVDGQGNLVRGGGKVVKNAAGFDLPKLMIGSLGQFGVLVELAFKVFPRPEATCTLTYTYSTLEAALTALTRLAGSPLEIFALELEPGGMGANLQVRVGGTPDGLEVRTGRVSQLLQQEPSAILISERETVFWKNLGEFTWVPADGLLVKIPLTARKIPKLDALLVRHHAVRRYSAGASMAWVAWPEAPEALHRLLLDLELSGLALCGAAPQPQLGCQIGEPFARRVRQALDPMQKFTPETYATYHSG